MTASFTTDPAKLVSKRLRSETDLRVLDDPFAVACGKAAHGGSAGGDNDPVIIVRLSDGVSWTLPALTKPNYYDHVVGLSCDHVYVLAMLGGVLNIARIRLDSLGPGAPPD